MRWFEAAKTSSPRCTQTDFAWSSCVKCRSPDLPAAWIQPNTSGSGKRAHVDAQREVAIRRQGAIAAAAPLEQHGPRAARPKRTRARRGRGRAPRAVRIERQARLAPACALPICHRLSSAEMRDRPVSFDFARAALEGSRAPFRARAAAPTSHRARRSGLRGGAAFKLPLWLHRCDACRRAPMAQLHRHERRRIPRVTAAGTDPHVHDRSRSSIRGRVGPSSGPARKPSPICHAAARACNRANRSHRAAACCSSWICPTAAASKPSLASRGRAWTRCQQRRCAWRVRPRARVPRRHARSRDASRDLPVPAPVGGLARTDGLIVEHGDGYAPPSMRPPGSYKIASRTRAFDALLGPEGRAQRGSSTRCATRFSRAATVYGSGASSAARARSSGSRSTVPELGYQRTTCWTGMRSTSCSRPTMCARSCTSDCADREPTQSSGLVPGAGLEPAWPVARRF